MARCITCCNSRAMTTHDEKPRALAGVPVRTWIWVVIVMVLFWLMTGYLVLR